MNDTIAICAHLLGLYLALNALFQSRTPQGALAWFVGLVGFPYLGIPLFVVFGRRRYHEENNVRPPEFPKYDVVKHRHEPLGEFEKFLQHTGFYFTGRNSIDLLIDADEIYPAMFRDLENAKEYILLQVFIFRTDETGRKFADILMRKAREGVKVYVLYEKVLIKMDKNLLEEMREAGVHLGLFKPFTRNKWHLQFRNHRKILVIDGKCGFFGGINIGDDYVGKYPNIGHWRDTNVRIEGPALIPAQTAFCFDWQGSQGSAPDVEWKHGPSEGEANVLIFSSGPIEEKPFCLLHHMALIELARKRLWIANPYIVPPQSLMDALAMAALHGVDVRILVPSYSDNFLIMGVADIYYERLMDYGVKIYKYKNGFLHEKVMVVDDLLGVVGSANLDFRSMYINFEITTVCSDPKFIDSLTKMLERDLRDSELLTKESFRKKTLPKKVLERATNLLAPVL
ncbi:MAG: cardiolipin synthase [Bacteriovoracaceae bacterium]